jgi:hypothetical protein
MEGRRLLVNEAQERNGEKDDGNYDGRLEENLIDASFGAVNVAGTAKSPAQTGSFLLKNNRDREKRREHQLNDIIDIFFHNMGYLVN